MKKTAKPPRVVKHPITIVVSGPPKCGKSILAMFIERLLRRAGFSTRLEDPEMSATAQLARAKQLPKLVLHLLRSDRAEIVVSTARKGRATIP